MHFGSDWCTLVQLGAVWCNLVQIGAILCRLVQRGVYTTLHQSAQNAECWCTALGRRLFQFGAP